MTEPQDMAEVWDSVPDDIKCPYCADKRGSLFCPDCGGCGRIRIDIEADREGEL